MPIQPGTFKRLPPKEEIIAAIEKEKEYNSDVIPFVWYIKPVADRFGDRVYDVAAASLSKSGLKANAAQLKEVAEELDTEKGKEKYARIRQVHLQHVTG